MLNNILMSEGDTADLRRKELRAFIKRRGLKIKPWAKDAEVSNGTVRNFLKGLSKTLTQATIEKLAGAAEATPAEIFPSLNGSKPQAERADVHHSQRTLASDPHRPVESKLGTQNTDDWPKDLKVLGHARAGKDGFFLDQGEFFELTPRPPQLANVKNAFAIYVRDDSMTPAFEPGWVVWINPNKPPLPGRNVIIELQDGQAFIKRFVRKSGKTWIFKQWNPESELKFDDAKIKAVHMIVGTDYGGGK